MNETELMLRAAFTWVRANHKSGMINYAHSLDFVASGAVKIGDRTMHRPHLRHDEPGRVLTVSISPAGRRFHYVIEGEHFVSRMETALPREFWTKSAVKDSLTARPNTERRSYVDLGDTGSAEEESGW